MLLRVEVEIDLASGLPQLATVGLPEGAVKESKDRIRAAVKNCGYTFPAKRITINLAPADIKKEGSAYDLPMAVGILAAEGLIQKNLLDDYFLIGELSLDGSDQARSWRSAHRHGGEEGKIQRTHPARDQCIGGRCRPRNRSSWGSKLAASSRVSQWNAKQLQPLM